MSQRFTDLYDASGHLLLSTLDIDVEAFDECYPTWTTAIVFERVVRKSDTAHLDGETSSPSPSAANQ